MFQRQCTIINCVMWVNNPKKDLGINLFKLNVI